MSEFNYRPHEPRDDAQCKALELKASQRDFGRFQRVVKAFFHATFHQFKDFETKASHWNE